MNTQGEQDRCMTAEQIAQWRAIEQYLTMRRDDTHARLTWRRAHHTTTHEDRTNETV